MLSNCEADSCKRSGDLTLIARLRRIEGIPPLVGRWMSRVLSLSASSLLYGVSASTFK